MTTEQISARKKRPNSVLSLQYSALELLAVIWSYFIFALSTQRLTTKHTIKMPFAEAYRTKNEKSSPEMPIGIISPQ